MPIRWVCSQVQVKNGRVSHGKAPQVWQTISVTTGRGCEKEAHKRIGHLYPKATLPDGTAATVVAWLWARTVPCANPACGLQMPLMKTFQLSKKKGNEHWVKPIIDRETNTISWVVQTR